MREGENMKKLLKSKKRGSAIPLAMVAIIMLLAMTKTIIWLLLKIQIILMMKLQVIVKMAGIYD